MSTMISFRDNGIATSFLSEDELRTKAPFVFAKNPTNPNVSNKYIQATTIDVVRDMAKLGWYPVEAKQCRPTKKSSGIRSFHMVAFQNPDVKIMKNGEVDAYPRIILTNSHDGFSSFKFMVGCFRLVCSNGLVIATEKFADIAIRHINYTFDELKKVVNEAVKAVPEQVEIMNRMRQVSLKKEEKEALAMAAIKIRKGLKEDAIYHAKQEDIDGILKPKREEDAGDDLWSIYNVLQEKIIKGEFSLDNGAGKVRKQRSITSVKKDIELNTQLFAAANAYAYAV